MKLLKNREVKLVVLIIAVLTIIFSAVMQCLFNDYAKTLNGIQIRQNTAVIGTLARQYPEYEPDIVRDFTVDQNENYEYGRKILRKYSYDENLPIDSSGLAEKAVLQSYIRLQTLIMVSALVLAGFLMYILYQLLGKIRRLSTGAEAVIEGEYQPIEGGEEEGDIGALTYQLNSMAERLGENVQALRQEKLFLKKLITDISHQLKTPLASLIMFNDILESDKNITGPERDNFVRESKNQLDRMEWLIKNMMKMAKLESGAVDFNKVDSYIKQTLQRSICGLSVLAAQKNIAIELEGKNDVAVRHDVSWTAEAFSNIIKNSIEHSKQGNIINITWEENNVFVQVVIQDNGGGIPEDELPRIFDRFYKGTGSCSPTNIGIGLYITKSIIEGQGGSIYAFSREGKGTKFIIRLMKIG